MTALDDPQVFGFQLFSVVTPSGSELKLQTNEEADWYESRRDRYQADNAFPNISDLQDLDRLLMLEVLVYRWSLWMAQGYDYQQSLINQKELKDNIREYSVELRQLKMALGIDKVTRDREKAESSQGVRHPPQRAVRDRRHQVHGAALHGDDVGPLRRRGAPPPRPQ